MDRIIRMRLGWVRLYELTGNAVLVCRRCRISASTLRKWLRRYRAGGVAGLEDELWARLDVRALTLDEARDEVGLWAFFYNWHRPHAALNGQAPIDAVCDRLGDTPTQAEVIANYDPRRERIQEREYAAELKTCQVKGCR